MMVRFVCRSCGQKFKANEEYAGQASQCPACGVMVQIPVAPATHSGPIPVEPEIKQDILKFKPVFKKSEPAHEQNIQQSEAVQEAPKLKMRLRSSPEFKDNVPPPSSPAAAVEPEVLPQFKLPENVHPASGIKLPPALKTPAAAPAGLANPQAAAPKQAFPVGFTPVSPKLPPGLTLVGDDES